MSEIVLRRPGALWQDRARAYRIIVDGEEVGTITNKSESRITVPPGRHAVRLRIDWGASPELVVDVGAGAQYVLECGPNAHPFIAVLYITIWKNRYLWLRDAGPGSLPAPAMS